MKKKTLLCTVFTTLLSLTACSSPTSGDDSPADYSFSKNPSVSFSFDSTNGSYTKEAVSSSSYRIDYVFAQENADILFKKPNDPVLKQGVHGKSLYMDGFSTKIQIGDYQAPTNKLTVSAWVAPRGFENLDRYGDNTVAKGHPRMTSIFNWGNMETNDGFLFGYGRLGLWGLQLNLHNFDNGDEFMVGYYDPINTLSLYEWNHIAATYDGEKGYICLAYNGKVVYEALIPELVNTEIIESDEKLYLGYYCDAGQVYGMPRQTPAGLVDEAQIYHEAFAPKDLKHLFNRYAVNGAAPELPFSEVAPDTSVYSGDRYRPQYHGIPPAVWMNEPHAPIYYKGMYHVFYQHNPIGPYWSQIRWAHICSRDMIHWIYVKDAVAPQNPACPEGAWTGGSVIGPDGVPWLTITAGTTYGGWKESSVFSHQSVCYVHPVDPDDPYLTDWTVEDTNVLVQPANWSQGKIEEFRDPFIWYDEPYYYMMVSTSMADDWDTSKGGNTNMFRSTDMRNWEYMGFTFDECKYPDYPEQGKHWECCVMFPISTVDGSVTKYIFFDSPQYTVSGYTVDTYYWIGTFDKYTCRFHPDDPKPRLFDYGKGIYTGQTGFCYITDEERAAGITDYEKGHTVIISLAQGIDAGTDQNKIAGWAHNLAMPVEIFLADNGVDLIRKPVEAVSTLYDDVLFEYSGTGVSASELSDMVSNIRSDMYEIKASFTLDNGGTYNSGIYVRYNPTDNAYGTERSAIRFTNDGIYVDRTLSTLLDYPKKHDTYHMPMFENSYDVTIYVDRSQLEIYINDIAQITTRIYPKYGDSDYISMFDNGGNINFTRFKITQMKGILTDKVEPAYYGNTGNLADLG